MVCQAHLPVHYDSQLMCPKPNYNFNLVAKQHKQVALVVQVLAYTTCEHLAWKGMLWIQTLTLIGPYTAIQGHCSLVLIPGHV